MALPLIAAGVSALGGVLGNIFDNDDEEAALAARKAALDAILGVNVPGLEEQKISLADYVEAGQLTPEMAAVVEQEASKMEGVSTDPRLREAQLGALAKLQGLSKTGFDFSDKVNLMQVENDTNRAAAGRNDAILMDRAQRGVAGSGDELAAQMMSAQQATNAQRDAAMQRASMAQQRALEAIMNAGKLGGDMRSQEFSEKSAVAQAGDAINNYNARNRQSVLSSNTNVRNSAQAANLANKQDIMNMNTGSDHKQEIHNKGLHQTKFSNDMSKAGAVASAQGNMAKAYDDSAAGTRGAWAGGASAIGSGINAFAGLKKEPSSNDSYDDSTSDSKSVYDPRRSRFQP